MLQRWIRPSWERVLPLAFCMALGGCHTGQSNTAPAIEFTKLPPAAQGGREKVDTIAGRVAGALSGQQIVVYARSGPWWVQPWPVQASHPDSIGLELGHAYTPGI
jgi:hypothetical protein